MKARTIALLWVLAAGAAVAQTMPPSQKVAADSKPVAAKAAAAQAKPVAVPGKPVTAKPAAAQAKPAVVPGKPVTATPAAARAKTAAPVPAQPKPVAVKPKPAATPVAKTAVKPRKTAAAEVKKAALRTDAAKGVSKRDPFLSPIRESGVMGPTCTTGKKCLAINTVVLRGIVKSQNGMIAVVESSTRRISYFLRENDPVFNGYVVKITGDTIVFRENVMDRLGKQNTRDVVMKVVAPVV
jgi:Tfp pilus assembly protein PilP